MFSHAMAVSSALAAANIHDPSYRARPPRGYERIATSGAIENAVYVNPRFVYRIVDWVSLNAGYLYARTIAPWVDPFRSGLNGGDPTGPLGAKGAHELGHEWTLGAEFTRRAFGLGFRGRVWGAWYRPGDVYDTPAGESHHDLVGLWFAGGFQW